MSPAPPSPASSNASVEQADTPYQEPGLAELVTFFLASKRSLSSTTHVWRANEIVTAAREALEENAVVAAKNAFVRRAISEQVTAIEAVQKGAETVSAETHDDFQAVVRACDEYSNSLNAAIDALQTTEVEAALRPADEVPKNLYDFMDESGVADLHDSIRASIDRYNEAHGIFEDRIEEFGNAITEIKGSLINSLKTQQYIENDPEQQDLSLAETSGMLLSTEAASPLPSLFQNLETHATECASLLQSLVRHYDLCVTALKHTEGGGAAVQQATGSLPNAQDPQIEGLGLNLQTMEEGNDAPPQPMFEEERTDMLAVLSKDAAEVEDVVREIAERLADMEEQYSHIDNYVSGLRICAQKLHATLRRLASIVEGVDEYIGVTASFLASWSEEKEQFFQKQEELSSLRELYENFSSAYDSLLLEVHRRRSVQSAMEKVVKEAQRRLEELWQDDIDERHVWSQEWGEFLPSDIWTGFGEPPSRFNIHKVEGLADVPRLKKETLEGARKRMGVGGGGGSRKMER